jgi:hypothetical protein
MLVTLFLNMPYRPIAFFSIYITSPIDLSTRVCICIRVIGGVILLRVLLVIVMVCKVSIQVNFQGLRVCNIGLSIA